ncbi:hypothetical protein F2Q68_00029364 [Brassica cretica]|uniref:Lactate/malate dehydrogenase C-terminal domain-containing protein n=1 Tax=Brassica cretica TaxID=69181 RepID=A0A8S9GF43_BRACR|nr:hypothetical protein F2Q68_00029364 [Brassica cretica]
MSYANETERNNVNIEYELTQYYWLVNLEGHPRRVNIGGNHSATQVPDFLNARINGRPVKEVITDHKWLEEGFTESVQKRGGLLN